MKTKKTLTDNKREKAQPTKKLQQTKSSGAYGDKVSICANAGCALRKKAKCFGFEGCPGFQAR